MDTLVEMEAQLRELQAMLDVANEQDKAGLIPVIEELQALLKHQSTESLSKTGSSSVTSTEKPILDDEYRKFQEEMKLFEGDQQHDSIEKEASASEVQVSQAGSDEVTPKSPSDIQDHFKDLIGMKCQAPFEHHWGQIGYYSALVFSVELDHIDAGDDDVLVRVIFTQPLSERMRPCQYFMSSKCRFEDECKFSHGELVQLSKLKDYKEPDFSSVKSGSRVLAKYSDGLWYPANVTCVSENGDCELTFENYREASTVSMSDVQPLDEDENDQEYENVSIVVSSESDDEETDEDKDDSDVPIAWVHMKGVSALGVWEQHTKGVGSKIMAKMGYIFGSGLGKHSEGRVEPVDAVIVPPGRSLDTIMKIKEKAGEINSSNLFSVERRMKRQQKRQKEREAMQEKKGNESQSIFNFMNNHLNLRKDSHDQKASTSSSASGITHKDSCESLSKRLLGVGDKVRQVTREISKCQDAIKRHEGRDKTTSSKMKEKLTSLEAQLAELKKSELKISDEQKNRNDKKKLTIF